MNCQVLFFSREHFLGATGRRVFFRASAFGVAVCQRVILAIYIKLLQSVAVKVSLLLVLVTCLALSFQWEI